MTTLRLPLSLSAALLLTFATAALADPTAGSAQAICDDSAGAASSEGDTETSSFVCQAAFCQSDWDCRDFCPSAKTATCVANACKYTYSTGGGGGGGPLCPARFCTGDWHCECNGRYGYCGPDSVCRF